MYREGDRRRDIDPTQYRARLGTVLRRRAHRRPASLVCSTCSPIVQQRETEAIYREAACRTVMYSTCKTVLCMHPAAAAAAASAIDVALVFIKTFHQARAVAGILVDTVDNQRRRRAR